MEESPDVAKLMERARNIVAQSDNSELSPGSAEQSAPLERSSSQKIEPIDLDQRMSDSEEMVESKQEEEIAEVKNSSHKSEDSVEKASTKFVLAKKDKAPPMKLSFSMVRKDQVTEPEAEKVEAPKPSVINPEAPKKISFTKMLP